MGNMLVAAFAALGAVVGLFLGGALGSILAAVAGSGDVVPVTVAALMGAVIFAWVGIRLAGFFAKPS